MVKNSYPNQPTVSVWKNASTASVTGNGATGNLIHGMIDINTPSTFYNTGSGLITFPASGSYFLSANLLFSNIPSSIVLTNNCQFHINGNIINMEDRNISNGFDNSGLYSFSSQLLQPINAGSTGNITCMISGGSSNQIGIGGDLFKTQRLSIMKVT